MERAMPGVSLRDRVGDEDLSGRNWTTDIAKRISSLKWVWAAHIPQRTDGRVGQNILEWNSRNGKLCVGPPPTSWQMAGLRPRVCDRCRSLLNKATGGVWERHMSSSRRPMADMTMMMMPVIICERRRGQPLVFSWHHGLNSKALGAPPPFLKIK